MPIESDADRTVMLADFGVTLTKSGNSITVILDKGYVEFNEVSGYKPVAMARTTDVSALSIAVTDAVTVDGVSYTVQVLQDDGSGFTQLVLEEV